MFATIRRFRWIRLCKSDLRLAMMRMKQKKKRSLMAAFLPTQTEMIEILFTLGGTAADKALLILECRVRRLQCTISSRSTRFPLEKIPRVKGALFSTTPHLQQFSPCPGTTDRASLRLIVSDLLDP